jgi:hypothetical protein
VKITRRRMIAALAPAAAAQTGDKPPTPQQELAAAAARVERNLEIVRKFRLDVAVEPDFTFRA